MKRVALIGHHVCAVAEIASGEHEVVLFDEAEISHSDAHPCSYFADLEAHGLLTLGLSLVGQHWVDDCNVDGVAVLLRNSGSVRADRDALVFEVFAKTVIGHFVYAVRLKDSQQIIDVSLDFHL